MSIVVLELSVPSDTFALGQVLTDHGDIRIELTQFVPIGTSLVPYFWVETADTEAFEATVRADDRVATLEKLDNGSGRTLYRIEWTEELNGFLSAVVNHDMLVEKGTGTAERWRFQLRGPDHQNLSAFHETLEANDIPAEIHRIREPDDLSSDTYGLTNKQRDAIELAFTEGYFTVPRETSLTDLAEMVSVSRQSFTGRLTRGLHNLVSTTVMSEK